MHSATDDDGWYHTRDIVQIDADRYITILGRRDNMFISGGENIYPEEIEKALEKLAGVAGALVVPVDDEKFGQRPVAFVRAQEGYDSDIIRFDDLRTILPGYKIPLRIFAWDEEIDAKPNRTRFRHLARKLFES